MVTKFEATFTTVILTADTDEADDLLKQQSELELAMKNQTLVSVEDLNSG